MWRWRSCRPCSTAPVSSSTSPVSRRRRGSEASRWDSTAPTPSALFPIGSTPGGVDWAFWCSYKYLNAGPGATGGLYVNRRHWGTAPGLAGWWGYDKARQFDMLHAWQSAAGAGAWQISTPSLLATAPLRGSLRLFHEAGLDALRAKSLAQTDYLARLLEEIGLTEAPYHFAIGTPRQPERRGGHLAVEHEQAPRIARALKARGIIPDFRAPNVIRLAPVPLYTSFYELCRTVRALKEIIDRGEHLRVAAGRDLVA